mgnify:CR=1 FL=1
MRGRADSGDLGEDLGDLFIALGEAAAERGTAVVLLFDEMQFLERRDLEALIAAYHHAAQRELPLTIAGAGLPLLARLAGEAKSYAERLFDFPVIDRLSDDAAREALERPARERDASFEPAATRAILAFTEGYPYFIQEFGLHVWNVAAGPTITLADTEAAKRIVLAQLDENFFRVRIARTAPAERHYLSAMASLGPGPYATGDIARALRQAGDGRGAGAREADREGADLQPRARCERLHRAALRRLRAPRVPAPPDDVGPEALCGDRVHDPGAHRNAHRQVAELRPQRGGDGVAHALDRHGVAPRG